MKLTYDPRYNVAYIRLKEKAADVTTLHISESLNVDISPDGTVYGIELLNAGEQLYKQDNGSIVVVNEALGDRQTLKLAS
ncbi:MAG: DUF2283 domain-containing protein [Fibrobacterota bacterium]